MRTKLRCGLAVLAGGLLVAGWFWLATDTSGAAIAQPTEHYRLDTGDTVLVWLDERRGVQCWAMIGTGLTCIPLTASIYNWPILASTP